jgi:hypothetical protein
VLTDGFRAAFHAEDGIIAAAALLALVLLRRGRPAQQRQRPLVGAPEPIRSARETMIPSALFEPRWSRDDNIARS